MKRAAYYAHLRDVKAEHQLYVLYLGDLHGGVEAVKLSTSPKAPLDGHLTCEVCGSNNLKEGCLLWCQRHRHFILAGVDCVHKMDVPMAYSPIREEAIIALYSREINRLRKGESHAHSQSHGESPLTAARQDTPGHQS